MKTSINNASPLLLIPLVVYVQFLWTGIYLLSRNFRDRFSVLAGLSMLGVCVYILGTTLGEISTSFEEAENYSTLFWIAPIIPVFWLHAILEQVGVSRKYLAVKKYSLAVLYIVASVLILLAQTTNLIIDTASASWVDDRTPRFLVEPGALYDFFIFFLFSVTFFTTLKIVGTAFRNWKLVDNTLKKYYVALGVSTAMFSAGGTLTSLDFRNFSTWKRPESQDQWIILLGLLILIIALIWYKFGNDKKTENSFIMNVDFVSQSLVVYLLTAAVVSILYFSYMKPPMIVWTITMVIIFFSGYEAVISKLNKFFEKKLAFNTDEIVGDESGHAIIGEQASLNESFPENIEENSGEEPLGEHRLSPTGIFDDKDMIIATLRILSNTKIGKDFEQASIYSSKFTDMIDPDGSLNNTEKAKGLYDLLWSIVNKLHPIETGNASENCLHKDLKEIDGEVWGPFACLLYLIYGGRKAPGEISRILVKAKHGSDPEEAKKFECYLRLVNWRGHVGRSNYRKVQIWEEIALDAFRENVEKALAGQSLSTS